MASVAAIKKYDGDGGNGQQEFIHQTEVGWKRVLNTPDLHVGEGQTQYEYLETLDDKLDGTAKKCHRLFVEKLDWTKADNPDLQEAISREEDRSVWRVYYKAKAVHDLRAVQFQKQGPPPTRPDLRDLPVYEPRDMEDFFAELKSSFRMASTNFLNELANFRGEPKESLTKLAQRFEEIAGPLVANKQMTNRHLAIHFSTHLPAHVKKKATSRMHREDERRWDADPKLPPVTRDELLKFAQKAEQWLLQSEADYRAAGVAPRPRNTEDKHQNNRDYRERRPMEDRLGIRDAPQLGPMPPREIKLCHTCGKPGHLAKQCRSTSATLPGPPARGAGKGREELAAHKTEGATCTACKKVGHMEPQCWSTHPELIPHELLKKRSTMTAVTRRSTRHKPYEKASDYTSTDYDFQGMALTYQLPNTQTRRLARTPQPSQRAAEAVAQRTVPRRVQFVTVIPPAAEATAALISQAADLESHDPLTSVSPSATPMSDTQDMPGVPEKYAYTERLPQSFPYGFPPSSLEPGTTDQQHPPSSLFPNPPMGERGGELVEAPLQTMASLQAAAKNMTELVAELSEALWRKAADREKHFPQRHYEREMNEEFPLIGPTVPEHELSRIHCTPVYIDNRGGVLDVDGYVPKETILDTGASKVMISKTFAAALKINAERLDRGGIFVTASGKVTEPIGITKDKLKFTLGRNTVDQFTVELAVTVVDTPVYDVLLGMEFVKAVKGVYDAYTESFTYRWMDGHKGWKAKTISAPCHSRDPPLMACACFGGLISGEEELQDVYSSMEEDIPENDYFGFHNSPLQLAATELKNLNQACGLASEAQRCKTVRDGDQLRRENAAARLSSVTPLSIAPLLPSSEWIGGPIVNAYPINTATRQFAQYSKRDGLHVMELFGGIGLGVLRTALAAGYTIRCYTYVDKDATSRTIAKQVLKALQSQYPKQLPNSAINNFDKKLPQNISQCSLTFLENLITLNGPVDLLGGSWECQSVSRAGRQLGAMDPRFRFFYDLVRMINFFQAHQASPLIYILENTYPGEKFSTAVQNAANLVESFIGAPVIVDAADLGSAAHRVRLFWTNMLQPAVLQAALPTMIRPSPPLSFLLKQHHIPTRPGHTDRRPYARHNMAGGARLCIPTVVSYLHSNAFKTKENGAPGEGQV